MNDPIKQKIITIGKAMLALGFQNTHSGNISVRSGDEMYITKTGSMKGHLEERDICKPGLFKPEYGLFQSSSETGEHRQVLQYAGAMIHAHSLPVVLLSYLVDEIRPLDGYGRRFLGTVPVQEFEYPVGSKEMEEEIPKILKEKPVMVVKTHGPFVRGSTLEEAFFILCLADHAARILLDVEQTGQREAAQRTPEIRYPVLAAYRIPAGAVEISDPVLLNQFRRTASDLFYLRLSPFQTGSLSVENGREMLYATGLAVPEGMVFDVSRLPIGADSGDFFADLHRAVYRHSSAKAALFTLSPEAASQSLRALARGEERLIPVDAEGGHLYPAVPVLLPDERPQRIVEMAVRYKMVVLAGLGALGIGHTPGHTIHHNSSLKNICYIRTQLEIMQKLGKIDDVNRYLYEKGKNW